MPTSKPAAKKVAAREKTARAPRWEVDDYLSYLLARASHEVASEFHREVNAAGLTTLEWRVLSTLADGRARSVGELATIALAKQTTITKLIGRMEGDGRVERYAGDTDRRQSLVNITPIGRTALGTLLTRSKKHERLLVARLSSREAGSLKSALKKLIAIKDG
jgi:DNA-binding MarR family transcriptional regulator